MFNNVLLNNRSEVWRTFKSDNYFLDRKKIRQKNHFYRIKFNSNIFHEKILSELFISKTPQKKPN